MPDLFKNKYKISSARLSTWDYADNGLYFITICTEGKECFFGDIEEIQRIVSSRASSAINETQLNHLGEIVEKEWLKTPELRPDMNIELAEYVVMPNHFHGIIYIGENQYNVEKRYGYRNKDAVGRDAMHRVSTSVTPTGTNHNSENDPKNKFGPQRKNLASIIRGFKSAVTTFARKNEISFNWQARFHDHIIASNTEYLRIAKYIKNNPDNWQEDKFYSK